MYKKLSKEEILSLAKERGIKISFLNDLIGGYRGKLTDWKNGKTTLTETELKTISDYLLGNEQTPSGNVYDQYSAEDLEIAKLYAALPDDDRRSLKEYLKYLADKNKKQN